jgi:phage shock protein A
MRWFRRRHDPAEDSLAETVLLEGEFVEVLTTHDEAEARLFDAHGEALSRGDFAEAERIESRIDELKAERAALIARQQAAQGKVDKPSAPPTG